MWGEFGETLNMTLIPINRPTTEADLQVVQRRAYSFAKKGDYASAIALCNWLIENPSTRVAGLRQRAAVYELQGEIEQAIEDLEVVISAEVNEPADMHALGLLYLQMEHNQQAEGVLAKGIATCLAENAPYYLNYCRLLHAEALLRLGKRPPALAALVALPEGYEAYVYGRGMRIKEVMMKEAQLS